MTALIWDEGMSVGIEVIDNDHKQIIAMLAKLTSVKHGKAHTQEIEAIFLELTTCISEHFVREEALLEQAEYSDIVAHKESHQTFIDNLPKLKQQCLAADNLATSESVTLFLYQWVINHILIEDLDYVSSLEKFYADGDPLTLSDNPKDSAVDNNNSVLAKVSSAFAKKIKLSQRVFITTLIPVFAVLLLCSFILLDNYQRYKNITLVLGLTNIIEQVNDVSHSLQAERGLSSGFASSNYQQFSQQLANQRLLTDKAITDIQYLLEHEIDPEIQGNIQEYLDDSRHDFEQLIEHRQQVDNKNVSFMQTYQVYTQLIEQLLSVSEHLIHVNMNSKLINDISAINSILLFKEYMGQVRAQGLSTVTAESDNIYSNIAISLLVGKQLNALRVFHYSASDEQKLLCSDYCNSTINQQLLAQGFAHIVQEHLMAERNEYWFDFMTIEINNLKHVTDELIKMFDAKVHQESQQLEYNNYIVFGVISLFLLSASFFSIMLNCSIISPIRRVTYALNCLAKGQYNIHFKEGVVSDDISAIKIAYEKLRRKLLQVNIFQATVERQKSEIEYRKSQQAHFEHLALTDALTGAVNRHQFNLVLADEIFKADNHKRPLTILLLDIDHFKQVNDTFGHGVGDEVLIKFYQACKAAARASDVVARIGGEEFVIILPNTNKENAFQFAELLRKKIQKLDIVVAEKNIKLTVSIGVSLWQKTLFSSPKVFIADADKLLYQAKTQGRNKVVTST